MTERKLLTIEEVARFTGMTDRTVRRRINSGELPARTDPRDRRRKLVHMSDLRRLVGNEFMRELRRDD